MIDIAFQFDLSIWKWVECNPKYVMPDISEIELNVVYQFWDNDNLKHRLGIWNKSLNRMLEVTEIKSADRLMDSAGREYNGLFTVVYNYADFSKMDTILPVSIEDAPFRWRIFQREMGMPLLLAQDLASIPIKFYKTSRHLKNITKIYGHSFLPAKNRYLSGYEGQYIPNTVYQAALNALQNDLAQSFGKEPAITPWIKSSHLVSSLCAVIEKPYAPNSMTLQKFIGKEFDEMFPRFEQDDFAAITKKFDINPPKKMREAYLENPFVIVIYLLFIQMGITNYDLISSFFIFSRSIFGIEFNEFEYNWEKRCVEVKAKSYYDYSYHYSNHKYTDNRLDNIKFFIDWLITEKNPAEAYKNLWLCMINCNDCDEITDFLKDFRDYFNEISPDIKYRLLLEGLTPNTIKASEQNIIKTKIYARAVLMGRSNKHLDIQINGYNFRVVDNAGYLPYISLQLHCEALTEYSTDKYDNIFFVSVDKGGKFVALIELSTTRYGRNYVVTSIRGDYFLKPSKEIMDATVYWIHLNRLDAVSDTLRKNECIWYDDSKFHRSECPPKKIYMAYTLDVLLKMTLPKGENADAYYHALALRLNETPLPHLDMPYFLTPKSEIEYLKYVFPKGYRLIQGAFDGNAQSQYELAVLYGNDRFFSPNRERMLYWYEQAAENGLPEAMWQMAVLKMLDKDYDEVEKRLKKLSEQSGMFGYMAKAVSYLLEKNALSIENIMGCMENFQSRG